jgi:hypothetical protein
MELNTVSSGGSGSFSIANGASIGMDGPSTLSAAIPGYSTYNFATGSTTDFYGTAPNNQIISNIPSLLTGGLGNVLITNSGTKYVNSPLWIRGNLTINNNALFYNSIGVNSLQVNGIVFNTSMLNNRGIMQIGP